MSAGRARIVCHRGACRAAPENTLASASAAFALGGDVIECDVRAGADGALWLMHDATVDRTTDGAGSISAMRRAQVAALDAGGWFAPAFAGERVPDLPALLAAARGRGGVYVEVKDAPAAAVAAAVRAAGMEAAVFFYSEDAAIRAALRADAPDLRRMVNRRDVARLQDALEVERADILEFHAADFSADACAAAQALGLEVMVYTDQPDAALFAAALDAGALWLNTDHPAMVCALRDG